MGRIAEIIQRHIDESPYPPSNRQIADRIGVSKGTITNWRVGTMSQLPKQENLEAIAKLTGTEYSVVLEAALVDAGYRKAGRTVDRPERTSL